MNLEICKFPRMHLTHFDWFKDNQLLSQLTHAHYRDTVPLKEFVGHFYHGALAQKIDQSLCLQP